MAWVDGVTGLKIARARGGRRCCRFGNGAVGFRMTPMWSMASPAPDGEDADA
jgi:hypothetical protein